MDELNYDEEKRLNIARMQRAFDRITTYATRPYEGDTMTTTRQPTQGDRVQTIPGTPLLQGKIGKVMGTKGKFVVVDYDDQPVPAILQIELVEVLPQLIDTLAIWRGDFSRLLTASPGIGRTHIGDVESYADGTVRFITSHHESPIEF
jgi:hypothetical protein